MKKTYETPNVEVVKFQYRDQVVAASLTPYECTSQWYNEKSTADDCTQAGYDKGDY